MNRVSSLTFSSFPPRAPFISLFSAVLFFFFSRSLRLALILYLIGSDLINFSENAIKRPPGFLPSPSFGYHLPLLFTPIPKPLRDPSNLSIQMREPTCTPCVVRRIAFYNREVLPRMLVTFPLREEGARDEARRDGRWTRLGNLQTTEKQRRTYVLFACKNEEKRESLRYRQEFFL